MGFQETGLTNCGGQNKQGHETEQNGLWLRNVITLEAAGTLETNWRTRHCSTALLSHPFPRHSLGRYQLQDIKWMFDPA